MKKRHHLTYVVNGDSIIFTSVSNLLFPTFSFDLFVIVH